MGLEFECKENLVMIGLFSSQKLWGRPKTTTSAPLAPQSSLPTGRARSVIITSVRHTAQQEHPPSSSLKHLRVGDVVQKGEHSTSTQNETGRQGLIVKSPVKTCTFCTGSRAQFPPQNLDGICARVPAAHLGDPSGVPAPGFTSLCSGAFGQRTTERELYHSASLLCVCLSLK